MKVKHYNPSQGWYVWARIPSGPKLKKYKTPNVEITLEARALIKLCENGG